MLACRQIDNQDIQSHLISQIVCCKANGGHSDPAYSTCDNVARANCIVTVFRDSCMRNNYYNIWHNIPELSYQLLGLVHPTLKLCMCIQIYNKSTLLDQV